MKTLVEKNKELLKKAGKKRSNPLTKMEWMILEWSKGKPGLEIMPEHQFDTDRKFRFDFAIPFFKIGIEYEGGVFMAISGHSSAKGYTKDLEKYNLATIQGWKILRYNALNYGKMINDLNFLIGDKSN